MFKLEDLLKLTT